MDLRMQELCRLCGLRVMSINRERITKIINTIGGGYRPNEVMTSQYIECGVCFYKYKDMNMNRVNCTLNCGNDLLYIVKNYLNDSGKTRRYKRLLHSRREEKYREREKYHRNKWLKRNKGKGRGGGMKKSVGNPVKRKYGRRKDKFRSAEEW